MVGSAVSAIIASYGTMKACFVASSRGAKVELRPLSSSVAIEWPRQVRVGIPTEPFRTFRFPTTFGRWKLKMACTVSPEDPLLRIELVDALLTPRPCTRGRSSMGTEIHCQGVDMTLGWKSTTCSDSIEMNAFHPEETQKARTSEPRRR